MSEEKRTRIIYVPIAQRQAANDIVNMVVLQDSNYEKITDTVQNRISIKCLCDDDLAARVMKAGAEAVV